MSRCIFMQAGSAVLNLNQYCLVRYQPTALDAGATAQDDMDGNLTARVVVSGLQQVDTSRPTAPGSPYLLRYDCTDAAGNSAQPVLRNVSVICPGAELACAGTDGALYCSTNGYCLGTASTSAGARLATSLGACPATWPTVQPGLMHLALYPLGWWPLL
jgi:hypothetical protein